ncbi:MAG TPA: dihydrolipoamide acetyltransferase family protein [Terriglobales bacterium]|nr:dihydrolipoamide acetyltransferase family protein [Terriglobales bacterium]
MPTSIVMPALELMQETGKLVAWRKQEGEAVAAGEVLAEVETDKAVVEVESPAAGVLAGVQAAPGEVVPVGRTIAWVLAPGESVPAAAVAAAAPAAAVAAAAPAPAAGAARPGAVAATPKARRLARERGVDLAGLVGTGANGAITEADVLAAGAAPAAAPAAAAGTEAALEAPTAVGRLMAERTTASWTQVPHFFVVRELEAGPLQAARERLQQAGTRATLTDLLIAIVARVLRDHPRLNASWTPEGIRRHSEIHMGLAIAVEDGVVAPVIAHADQASVAAIAARRQELAERARGRHLQGADLAGATFTLSNLGMFHVTSFTAIINAPQAAILAVGGVADRVVAVAGRAEVRPMLTCTLSCDHRVVSGAHGAAFLEQLASALAAPGPYLG